MQPELWLPADFRAPFLYSVEHRVPLKLDY